MRTLPGAALALCILSGCTTCEPPADLRSLREVVAEACTTASADRLLSLLDPGTRREIEARAGGDSVAGLSSALLDPPAQAAVELLRKAPAGDPDLARVLGDLLRHPAFRRDRGRLVVGWWAGSATRTGAGNPAETLDRWLDPAEPEEFLSEVVACRPVPPGEEAYYLAVAGRADLPLGPRAVAVQCLPTGRSLATLLDTDDPWLLAEVLRALALCADAPPPGGTWARALERGAAASLRLRSWEFDEDFLGTFLSRTLPPGGGGPALRDYVVARMEGLSERSPPEAEEARVLSWLLDAWAVGAETADWERLSEFLAGDRRADFLVAFLEALPAEAAALAEAVGALSLRAGEGEVRAGAVRCIRRFHGGAP